MNDKLIINSISKIYFSIVSFFLFIVLVLSIIYLLLSTGVHLKNIKTSSINIDKLYIKWDKKLNIHIQKIDFLQNDTDKSFDLEYKNIPNNLLLTSILGSFVESIVIEEFNYKDTVATLRYIDDEIGYFGIKSTNLIVDVDIKSNKNFINFDVKKFKHISKKIDLTSNIIIDKSKNKLYLSAKTEIGSDVSMNINVESTINKFKYSFSSNKNIKSIKHLISIFNPNKAVNYWANEAINIKYITLKNAHGWFDFINLEKALENLYVHANCDSFQYTYNKKLDDIYTKTTDLIFKDGVLFIIPNDSSTYQFDLDSSWLKIDFTKKEEILTLFLQFDGMLDKNLLHLLTVYDIKLPFIQNSGYMDTDLKLVLNLRTIDVDINGYFYTNKANFTYLGLDLDLTDTLVYLNNLDVKIPKMTAKYKDISEAKVSAQLDLKNDIGLIDFNINKIALSNGLKLDTNKQNLNIKYIIDPKQDIISISKSHWNYEDKNISIGLLSAPFDYDTLFATIPTTKIIVENIATAYVTGESSLKDLSTKLDFDIIKFKYNDVELSQSNTFMNLVYLNDKLHLSSNKEIKLNIGALAASINSPNIEFYQDNITANFSNFTAENLFSSDINFSYSKKNLLGKLNFKNLIIKNEDIGKIFKKDDSIEFDIKSNNNEVLASSVSMDTSIIFSKEKWKFTFNSLATLEPYSPFLQKYKLNNGKLSIYQNKNSKKINFAAKVNYLYKLLNIDSQLRSNYSINGEFQNNNISIDINNKINILIAKDIYIKGKDVGINLDSVLNVLNDFKNKSNKSANKNLTMSLKNSFIHLSDKRRIIADEIKLQYYDNITTAQLIHSNGKAGFKLQNDLFHMYGKGFNDKFMENLFSLSKFKEGSFDFNIKGTLEKYSGILYIKDTTVIEYKMLNNIFAFINTIPSLVTFSLPGYSKNGLNVDSAYVNFEYKNKEYLLNDIYLDSKEIDIIGRGSASYIQNRVDLKLNLKTDLGSVASKIPIVGYIIFGENAMSTSLKVTGRLDDPKVKSMIAKDIIVAPLNIIKRTLLLPFYFFKSKDEDEK